MEQSLDVTISRHEKRTCSNTLEHHMQLHSASTKRTTPAPRIWKTFRRRRGTTCTYRYAVSAFKNASVVCSTVCKRACAKHGVRRSTSFKNHCATRVVSFVCDHGLLEVGSSGFCRQKNWQNSVLFLVSLMHVWYVDKEMEQNSRNCPP